jgi:hypothetical protein
LGDAEFMGRVTAGIHGGERVVEFRLTEGIAPVDAVSRTAAGWSDVSHPRFGKNGGGKGRSQQEEGEEDFHGLFRSSGKGACVESSHFDFFVKRCGAHIDGKFRKLERPQGDPSFPL